MCLFLLGLHRSCGLIKSILSNPLGYIRVRVFIDVPYLHQEGIIPKKKFLRTSLPSKNHKMLSIFEFIIANPPVSSTEKVRPESDRRLLNGFYKSTKNPSRKRRSLFRMDLIAKRPQGVGQNRIL